MDPTISPYRDDPNRHAIHRALDAANERAERSTRQRNVACIALASFVGLSMGHRLHEAGRRTPIVLPERDASLTPLPPAYCDIDTSVSTPPTFRLRCWSPMLTMVIQDRVMRDWYAACFLGENCTLHRQCPRRPHWQMTEFDLPLLSGSDAGASSQ